MKDLQTVLDALIALTEHACACNDVTGEIWGDGVTAIGIVKQMMQAEPVAWIVFDECGIPVHSTVHPKMAQDHINDALQEHDIQEAAKWVVRPVYAAPQAVPDTRLAFEKVKEALTHARNIAMEQIMKARIPECGEFGAIAQNLDWVLNVALAQQVAPQAVPAGYVLVPVEPTQSMCIAGQDKARECPKFPLRISPIYQAMLAAAPKGAV